MGTPLYMSPEQCRDSATIDYRTDIYSLGCVMFEMLTRRPPFVHDGLGDLVVAHMTEAPKDARTLNPSVPAALAQLVGELLRKDPATRPADMRVVAERLTNFLARATTLPESVPAPAPGPAARAGAGSTTFGDAAAELSSPAVADDEVPARSRRPLLLGAAVLAVALVGGALAATRGGTAPDTAKTAPAQSTATRPTPTPDQPAPPATKSAAKPARAADDDERGSDSGKRASGGTPAKRRLAQATPVAPPPLAAKPVFVEPNVEPPASAHPAGVEPPSVTTPPPPPPAVTAPPAPPAPTRAAAAPGFAGDWEGPWTDPEKHQNGRLSLHVAPDGAVTGWMANTGAHQTFRMLGRLSPAGALEFACQCPPNQSFFARGAVRGAQGNEMTGQLALSTRAAVFGQSQLTLKRR